LPGRPRPDRPGTAHPAAPDASSSSWRFATRHSSISAHRRPGPSYYRSTPLSAETCAPTPRNQRPVSMPPRPRRANLGEPSGQTALIPSAGPCCGLGQPRFLQQTAVGLRGANARRRGRRSAPVTVDEGICGNDASGTGNLFGVDGSDGGSCMEQDSGLFGPFVFLGPLDPWVTLGARRVRCHRSGASFAAPVSLWRT